MSENLYVYPDAALAAIEVLRAARSEHVLTDTVISDKAPDGRASQNGHLQVALDDDTLVHPIVAYALVRVSAYAPTRALANDLGQLARSVLLSHSGDQIVAARPATGLSWGTDPDTDDALVTFSVTATLRSVPAPS